MIVSGLIRSSGTSWFLIADIEWELPVDIRILNCCALMTSDTPVPTDFSGYSVESTYEWLLGLEDLVSL